MTTARHRLVDPALPGFYHCTSRCVRRAWLCGKDPVSGRSFEHRRGWIETRLLELADIFAVGLHAYAVTSNHVHVVLRIDPEAAQGWTDDAVAARWVRLFPACTEGTIDPERCRLKQENLLGDPPRLAQCRARLGSLSWFMRSLNEPIARRANREDARTGRFWEGRYHCQALLDEAAVLACMSYVDLSRSTRASPKICPVRTTPAPSAASNRIESIESAVMFATQPLHAINPGAPAHTLSLSTGVYLELIDWTARLVHPGKRSVIHVASPPILSRLGLRESHWKAQVLGIESRYWRAIGTCPSPDRQGGGRDSAGSRASAPYSDCPARHRQTPTP